MGVADAELDVGAPSPGEGAREGWEGVLGVGRPRGEAQLLEGLAIPAALTSMTLNRPRLYSLGGGGTGGCGGGEEGGVGEEEWEGSGGGERGP